MRFAVLLGFLGVVAVGAATFFGDEEETGGAPTTTGPPQVVSIPQGMTAGDVASLLEDKGIVDSQGALVASMRISGVAARIKPGVYEFVPGESTDSILRKLEEGGRVITFKVTIPEGLTIAQTSERLEDEEHIEAGRYEEIATSPGELEVPSVGGEVPEVESLEGFLFPSTYEMSEEEGARGLVQLQLRTFSAQTADLPWSQTDRLGVTPYQAVIVASLIEKEARVPEERAKVAAVIYNRLKEDMPLGIDATVRYALEKWTEPLTVSDLEVDSPYNTRREAGLPPGPIASPGLAALEAALDPVDEDYLYYVLIDEEGHHFFTDSYEEFLEAKEESPVR